MKAWKKRLKRHRRSILSLGVWVAAVLTAAAVLAFQLDHPHRGRTDLSIAAQADAAAWSDNQSVSFEAPDSERGRALAALAKEKGALEVLLHREYLCGEEMRRLGRFSSLEAMDLLKAHREWQASFDGQGRIIMEEAVDDLAESCRGMAYIGLDRDGNLSLFDGPTRKEKVIRTFFQLDVKSMESALSPERLRELREGIRISDRESYHHVLSSLSPYASRAEQTAMKQTN